MANPMSTIYASLIKEGKKTIDQVPEHLRKEVEAMINDESKETGKTPH